MWTDRLAEQLTDRQTRLKTLPSCTLLRVIMMIYFWKQEIMYLIFSVLIACGKSILSFLELLWRHLSILVLLKCYWLIDLERIYRNWHLLLTISVFELVSFIWAAKLMSHKQDWQWLQLNKYSCIILFSSTGHKFSSTAGDFLWHWQWYAIVANAFEVLNRSNPK